MIIKSKTFLSNPVKNGEKSRVIAEIYVDKISELPAHDYDENFDMAQGSVAYVVQSGEIYVMGSDGKWYDTNGKQAQKEDLNELI